MKYGPEKTLEIAQHLREGSNRTDACLLSDISYETFTEWMKKPEFSEPIKKAEAECKARNIKIIQKAAITTWQAAAWWLERKHHVEFALKNQWAQPDEDSPAATRMAERAHKILEELKQRKRAAAEKNGAVNGK